MVFETDRPGADMGSATLPAECSWTRYLISLSLNFFIYAIKIIIVPTS